MPIERKENETKQERVNKSITRLVFTLTEFKTIINASYPGPPTMIRSNEDITSVRSSATEVFVDLEK